MALKIESRTLGANEYEVVQLGAVKGRETLRRLGKLSIPALTAVIGVWKPGTGIDGNEAALLRALMHILNTLDESDLKYFCDTFGPNSTVTVEGGKKPRVSDVFDLHFAGNYMEMALWLAFCIEVNFVGSFLGGTSLLGGAAKV